MRLLLLSKTGELSFSQDFIAGDAIPPYAILSHTWDHGEEVTFRDLMDGAGKNKTGYKKIQFCGQQAERDGLQYFWVDTCCIDKSSSAELQEAINSMFRWYRNAERCYVYLSDVLYSTSDRDHECLPRWKPAFKRSRWFTRGWTLQELIAPASVEFFSKEGTYLGNKQSLEQTVHEITGIAVAALRGSPLSQFSKDRRLSWAAKRKTTREEDMAYCLLGIFDAHMPLIYGEGREHALARLEDQIRKPSKGMVLSLDDEQRRILIDSLRFDQIDARQMTIKNAYAKTCKWLLTKPEYIDWLDTTKLSEHHGFLWIKGKPGTGKSTLMKFALTNARKTMKDTTIISFFFNARGEDLEKSTIGTYRSLLLQLLERHPALQCVFDSAGLSSSSIRPDHEWSIELLKSLLEQAIQKLEQSSVVCFIDALDECEEEQVRDMIQFFERVGELSVSAGIRFQVCFSSRHYPHITIQKGLSLVLEGQEGHNQDIANYLESELRIGKRKIAQQVRSEVQEKASGVFMWVVLVVGILNKEHDRGRIHALRDRLREIPNDLHTLFRDILTRDSHNRDELALCIQWVLFAKKPLNPQQLYFAILSGVEPEAISEWDTDEVTEDVIKLFILDSSKGLAEITISRNQKVQFIHESVRDFLLKENGLGDIWPDLKRDFQGQSHERLKQCCLNYMTVDVFTILKIPEILPETRAHQAAEARESAGKAFPFLEYAAQNILYHANAAEGGSVSQTSFLQSFQLTNWINHDNLFQKHALRRHTPKASLLYILAEHNMANLIRNRLDKLSCFKVEDERYGLPVLAAVATGGREAVCTLLKARADSEPLTSPLHNLYEQYYKDRSKQASVGRDFKFSQQRSLLLNMAAFGNETLLAFTLASGVHDADIEAADKNGRTSLSLAAATGHEAIVRLLLDKGAAIDAADKNGRTPLLWTITNKHKAVMQLLLDKGAVIEAADKDSQTPLSWAAATGHEAIVRLFLNRGAAIDAADKNGWTPLSWAAATGHEAIVRLLLNRGAAIDAADKSGRTPLSLAAATGHEAIVRLLLDKGAAIDAADKNGRTPLLWTITNKHKAVMQLLLDKGAVIEAADKDGRTPLSLAAATGHEAVVRLLLNKGAAIDAADKSGRTPLSWAAATGHEAVVRLLLNKGAVIEAADKDGLTPLLWAAKHKRNANVQLLLDKGAAVEAADKHGRTPLSLAAEHHILRYSEATVRLLLDKGAAINKADVNGRTPLSWAAETSSADLVRLLFDKGAAVNIADVNGKMPLSWAALNKRKAIMQLLIDKGAVIKTTEMPLL